MTPRGFGAVQTPSNPISNGASELGVVELDDLGRRMCGAHRKKGGTCRAPALTGQTRCRSHGGASPQAKRAARDRLAEEADPSISRLVDLRDNAASEAVRAKAATTLLEMAGYGRHVAHEVNVLPPAEARRQLLNAILELRARPAEPPSEVDVIDAELVEEVNDDD